jgi:glycerol-3-phosphate acyltransferase PlsY
MLINTFCLLFAYLLGSLSTSIITAKALKLSDPRESGSKNAGATNALRLHGKKVGVIVLLGDLVKGVIPVIIARLLGLEGLVLGIVALTAILGHIYPIFFNFKGGKGIATAAGSILALSPLVGILVILVWLLVAYFSKYSSLAAISAIIATPILLMLFDDFGYFYPMLLICAILLWRHQGNIKRLLAGNESKISM